MSKEYEMPQTTHSVRILWGGSPEPGDKAKTYTFQTEAERHAFMLGVAEMDGWMGYRELEDNQSYCPGCGHTAETTKFCLLCFTEMVG